jgi:hypothetical protein
LPAILRACLLDVRLGKIEPSVASAIAALAKASVALSHDLELEARISALEAQAGVTAPANVRSIASRRTS